MLGLVEGNTFCYKDVSMEHLGNFSFSLESSWKNVSLGTKVPWVMCKQENALDPIINTCIDFPYDSIVSGFIHSMHIDISTLSVDKNFDWVFKSIASAVMIDALHWEIYEQYIGKTRG